jgi:hypothetical protein
MRGVCGLSRPKQFCVRGHDTHVVGRSGRQCKECRRVDHTGRLTVTLEDIQRDVEEMRARVQARKRMVRRAA